MRHVRPEDLPEPRARQALARFCREARAIAGKRVGRLIVYGSMARGDAGPYSDLDVWVEWHADEVEGRSLLGAVAGRIFAEDGVLVTAHVVSEPHRRLLQEWDSAFYRAVQAEGLVVDA